MAYNIIFYFSDQQRWDTCGRCAAPAVLCSRPENTPLRQAVSAIT